jgi:ABC-type uncharacterized transport system substrate-binding protein
LKAAPPVNGLLQILLPVLLIFLSSIAFADIAIIRTAGVAAYDEARNGFSSICFEAKQEFNLLEDLSNQAQVINDIRNGNYRLLVGIGSQAALLARSNFPNTPLVFCLVVNPDKLGLKGDNVTGISLGVPIREQFSVLHSISKKAKRIGVIYTAPGNDSLIATARQIASEQGMSLVTAPITSSTDIQKAMSEIIGNCDVLWIPPDPSLNSDEVIRYIGSTSLSKQVPCVGPSDRYVRSGAIFSLAPDTIEAGRMAGDLANKILQGTQPSKLPVQEILKPRVILNLKAASLLGLTIPKNVQDAASKVYQ